MAFQVPVRIQQLRPTASFPAYQTPGSAGMDLHAAEELTIYPGEIKLVKCGFAMEIPDGYEAQVRSRSGLTLKQGIIVANAPGTIDSDYRGEVGVILTNIGALKFDVKVGDRIAQMVIAEVRQAALIVATSLDDTERGQGGFGSSGV